MDQPLDLRGYVSILWARKRVILAIAVTTTAAALVYSFSQTPVSTSSAEVLVLSSSFASAESSATSPPLNMTKEEQVANSAPVERQASLRLAARDITPGSMSASEVEFAETLVFTSVSPDPEAAQATAQAHADAYLELRRTTFLEELEGARQPYESQIEDLDAELLRIAEALQAAEEGEGELLIAQYAHLLSQRDAVVTTLNNLVAPESVDVGRILRSASLPTSPSAPSQARDGLLGLVVGLALGMGVAFFQERLDEPVRGREELELQAGAPVLGFVPSAGWQRALSTTGRVPVDAAEAFRALRVRLLHTVGDRNITSLVITSSLAGEGKTSVTANLGVALAVSGKRVVIVAADLRRPQLQTYFQGSGGDVLTEVLPGQRQHEIAVSTTGTKNLWVLHAGRETADFVLIDTPPLLSTSDVVAVAPLADAILMVVDPHLARRSTLEQARHELDLIDVPVLGVVVNKHDPSRFRGYGFGYAYYGYGHPGRSEIAPSRTLRAIPDDSEAEPTLPLDDREPDDLFLP